MSNTKKPNTRSDVYKESIEYHKLKPYGKMALVTTKPLDNQYDLSLAYTPGVAEPCMKIVEDPSNSFIYTSRSNLVAVISNGTAVLGLGNIGALASKPVMEGKAALFKKFAGINSYDIEINETDPDKLIDIIASLEPTLGGINLEDIKAPECFKIEKELIKRLSIPVFHDDQHGTAIVVSAGLLNALELQNKKIEDIKIVVSGAGSSAIACLNLLVSLGAQKENIIVCDTKGVINNIRDDLNEYKKAYATNSHSTTLREALKDADVFLGLSAKGAVNQDMIKTMSNKPIIFALANPEPEILPSEVILARTDAIVASGRSDFPNQINNLLCFPFLFRGALDVRAKEINIEMKKACVYAISALAKKEIPDYVQSAYDGNLPSFGKDCIIPKPFDKRLYVNVSSEVAKVAMETGVAGIHIDIEEYKRKLEFDIL